MQQCIDIYYLTYFIYLQFLKWELGWAIIYHIFNLFTGIFYLRQLYCTEQNILWEVEANSAIFAN